MANPVTIVTIRGTGESQNGPENMLSVVTAALDPGIYSSVVDLDYPASVGMFNSAHSITGVSEDVSVSEGMAALATAIRTTPYPVGLLGYSLGAVVASHFLELKAQGLYTDCEIAWAGFVANPCRSPGESLDPGSVGEGINGPHRPWPSIPTWTVANPLDGITSCPAQSPLRDLADGLSAFSFASLGGWSAGLAHRLLDGEWPTTDYSPMELLDAGQLMLGYLAGGQHTNAYVYGGYCTRLAAAINQHAATMGS